MKKFLTLFAVAATCSMIANAQTPTDNQDNPRMENRGAMREHFKNATPEQKKHMEEMKKKFDSLTPEQKEAVKKEMMRHRQEIKKITGFDEMMPPMPGREEGMKGRK